MYDMNAADAQDLLPDLLHGRLSDAARADVERVILSDPDLAVQLALLQQVHAAHAAMPTIDMSRILAALPAASGQRAEGTVSTTTGNFDELAARQDPARSASHSVASGHHHTGRVARARREYRAARTRRADGRVDR